MCINFDFDFDFVLHTHRDCGTSAQMQDGCVSPTHTVSTNARCLYDTSDGAGPVLQISYRFVAS